MTLFKKAFWSAVGIQRSEDYECRLEKTSEKQRAWPSDSFHLSRFSFLYQDRIVRASHFF